MRAASHNPGGKQMHLMHAGSAEPYSRQKESLVVPIPPRLINRQTILCNEAVDTLGAFWKHQFEYTCQATFACRCLKGVCLFPCVGNTDKNEQTPMNNLSVISGILAWNSFLLTF